MLQSFVSLGAARTGAGICTGVAAVLAPHIVYEREVHEGWPAQAPRDSKMDLHLKNDYLTLLLIILRLSYLLPSAGQPDDEMKQQLVTA